MRTYLAPLGSDSRQIIRPVLSEGLDGEDHVVLLRSTHSSERDDEAFEEVEEILTQVVPELDLGSARLPYNDFVETTLYSTDLIQEAEGDVIVILGGGAREILLPLTVATFSNDAHVDTILQVGDIDNSVRRIPRLNLRGSVSGAEEKLLADIFCLDTPLSISNIATELDKSKSTIARHVTSLESQGFVVAIKDGRKKNINITDAGRIYLRTIANVDYEL